MGRRVLISVNNMEENWMMKCIKGSGEYGLGILDCFQYEPVYVFPKSFVQVYKPGYKVKENEILRFNGMKCGVDCVSSYYILSFLVPDIPDFMIRNVMKDVLALVQPIFAEITFEEFLTPKSTDRHNKPKKALKPEILEKISEKLDNYLIVAIYKLYPYFLYDDENFEYSSINIPSLSLPTAFNAIGCSFALSVNTQLQIDMISHVLFHESTVTVHEILSLDPPSGIIKDLIFIYKGCVISGSVAKPELVEVLKIYNLHRMYLRNESFAEEHFSEKVKIDGNDFRLTLVANGGLTLAIIIAPITEGANDYDPWMVSKAKRLLSEMNESKLMDKIEQEFDLNVLRIESSILDASKKLEIFNNMKKSRSLDSSPIGSPRAFGLKDKKYTPVFMNKHKIRVFHYALVNLKTGLVNYSQVYAGAGFIMGVIRPLLSHYANLYEEIQALDKKDSLEIQVKFGEYLECEKVAVVYLDDFFLFSLYQGSIQGLKQFAYELICVSI